MKRNSLIPLSTMGSLVAAAIALVITVGVVDAAAQEAAPERTREYGVNLRHYLSYDSTFRPPEGSEEDWDFGGWGTGLDLSNTDAQNRDLQQLKEDAFRNIRWMNLRGTAITDSGLRFLKGLPLRTLILEGTEITGTGFPHLKGLPLQMLILEGTPVNNDGLRNLAEIPLEYLDLTRTEITDEGIPLLKQLPLKSLNLYSTRITDAGLLYLPVLNLKKVYLTGTQVTDAGVEELKRKFPSLEIIY